ncbi:hypothetical protein [Dyella sp. ASV21]|uniref:hypothetical protein n=1 Tax=Dyella sp. ASV21 TaxID=2795114 RepID=UPI0018EB2DC1|nr:hypothetical protein [Dyella sp. ASV21]
MTPESDVTVTQTQSGGAQALSLLHEPPVCMEPLTEPEHLVLQLIHLDPRLALHRHRVRLRLVAQAINRWLSIRDIGRALMKLREHRLHGHLHTRGLEPIDWERWQSPCETEAIPVIRGLLKRSGWEDVPETALEAQAAHVVRLIATQ